MTLNGLTVDLRRVLSEMREHVGGEEGAAESELQRIVIDPRFCARWIEGRHGNPIALIRTAFREDWIWTRAEDDDSAGHFARAFAQLPPGDQVEIARLFSARTADGTPLI